MSYIIVVIKFIKVWRMVYKGLCNLLVKKDILSDFKNILNL